MNYNDQKIKMPFLFLGLGIILIFTNNHPALFISDYYWPLLLFSIFGVLSLFSNQFRLQMNEMTMMSLVLTFFLLVGTVFHINKIDSGTLLSYIVWFFALICGGQLSPNKKSIDFLMISFFIASIIVSFMVVVFKIQYLYQGSGRGTIQFLSNVPIDPNYLAYYMFVGFSFGLFYFKRLERKLLLILFEAFISYGILLTGSRMGLLCITMVLIGYILQSVDGIKDKGKYFVLFISPFVMIGIFAALIKVLPSDITSRFALSGLWDTSNSRRVDHWYHAILAFTKNPFGYGAMPTLNILNDYANSYADAHNTFLSLLLQFGICGFFAFVWFFIKIVKSMLLYSKEDKYFWIAFIAAFCVGDFIIANQLGISFWVVILILFFISKFPKEQSLC